MSAPVPYHQRSKLDPARPSPGRTGGDAARTPADERAHAVGETILLNVGRPDDLVRVEARRLWDDCHYRVDLIREVRGEPRRLKGDSYFVALTEDGFIREVNPPPVRRHWDDLLAEITAARG